MALTFDRSGADIPRQSGVVFEWRGVVRKKMENNDIIFFFLITVTNY